jgi:hypothetical protein
MAHQAKMQMKMKLFSHQQRGCQPALPKKRIQSRRLALQDNATVTARKDVAPAADQAAPTNVAGSTLLSAGGGLIQTTDG